MLPEPQNTDLITLLGSRQDTISSKKKKKKTQQRKRLPEAAVLVLDEWFTAHRDNPYPNAAERASLCEQSGLTRRQVDTWLGNARQRRGDVKAALDPMATWLSESSEDEAADYAAIVDAATQMPDLNPYGTDQMPDLGPFCIQNHDNISRPGSVSSLVSAFDGCLEARWQGPPKRGRKKYISGYGATSRNESVGSLCSLNFSENRSPASANALEIPSSSSFEPIPPSFLRTHNTELENLQRSCPSPSKFNAASTVVLRCLDEINPRPEVWQCRICKSEADTIEELRLHISQHDGEKRKRLSFSRRRSI
jgi:hypothetical protein